MSTQTMAIDVSAFGMATASPKTPPPSRVASMEAPGAPVAKRVRSFFLLESPVDVSWDSNLKEFVLSEGGEPSVRLAHLTTERTDRLIADLDLVSGGIVNKQQLVDAGKLDDFKALLPKVRQSAAFFESMGGCAPPHEPTSPSPEETIKYLERELQKERTKVRETGDAYTRLEKLHCHETVAADLLRSNRFEQLVAHAKAVAKPTPLAGRKRPASAMW